MTAALVPSRGRRGFIQLRGDLVSALLADADRDPDPEPSTDMAEPRSAPEISSPARPSEGNSQTLKIRRS